MDRVYAWDQPAFHASILTCNDHRGHQIITALGLPIHFFVNIQQ